MCRQGAPETGLHREAAKWQPIWKSFHTFMMGQLYQRVLVPVNTAQTQRWKTKVWPLTLPLVIQVASVSILPHGHPGKWHPCRSLAGNAAAQAKDHFYKDTPTLSASIPWKPQSSPWNIAAGAQAQFTPFWLFKSKMCKILNREEGSDSTHRNPKQKINQRRDVAGPASQEKQLFHFISHLQSNLYNVQIRSRRAIPQTSSIASPVAGHTRDWPPLASCCLCPRSKQ